MKISNSCVGFESNRLVTNYSIRFEISNIRTALELARSLVSIEADILDLLVDQSTNCKFYNTLANKNVFVVLTGSRHGKTLRHIPDVRWITSKQ